MLASKVLFLSLLQSSVLALRLMPPEVQTQDQQSEEDQCTLHNFEISGIGNQMMQISNAMRKARCRGCKTLALPNCEGGNIESTSCGGNLMWHGKGSHIAEYFPTPTQISLDKGELASAENSKSCEGSKKDDDKQCFEGGRKDENGTWHGAGWPYCYTTPEWGQTAKDLSQVFGKYAGSIDMPETLVVHLRGGDVYEKLNQYSHTISAQKAWRQSQPPCSIFLDAARTGKDGGPFEKVLIISAENSTDRNANPCYAVLVDKLGDKVVDVAQYLKHDKSVSLSRIENRPQLSKGAKESLHQDLQILTSAQYVATSCSTFSLFAPLMNPGLRRLFMPTCANYNFAGPKTELIGDTPINYEIIKYNYLGGKETNPLELATDTDNKRALLVNWMLTTQFTDKTTYGINSRN